MYNSSSGFTFFIVAGEADIITFLFQ